MLVQDLISYVSKIAEKRTIKDVRIGIGYVVVVLNDDSCGLAFTFRNELGPKCGLVDEAGTIKGRSCNEITSWAMSTNLLKAALGIACINALCKSEIDERFIEVDAMEVLDIKDDETLGIIGYYKPVLEKKKDFAKKIYVFERNITDEDILYPDWSEDIYLPECDVVIITGTTLINKTVDHIISCCTKAREIAIIGPTCTLCPSVFKKHGVTLIAGVEVMNNEKVLDIAAEGGGGLNIKDYIKQLCVKL